MNAFSDALLRTQTDERLVALTRAGHERAFAAIVERYRRPLLGFARQGTSEGRAEDVVQQALMSAWAALAAGAEVAHLSGWLHQIVRHESIRVAQREGRQATELLDPGLVAGGAAAEAQVEQRLQLRETIAGIAKLPEHQREALVQTAVEGRSRSEVASRMGMSEGAVRQLVHRARSTLRTAVTAITPFPVAGWLASVGGGAGPGVADLAAGAGTAAGAGVLLKVGAVVLATGAVAGGVAVEHHSHARHARPAQTVPASTAGSGSGHRGEAEPGDDRSGRGSDSSGHGSGSGRDSGSGHGSGSFGSGSGGSGSSGHGSGSGGSGSDGSGSSGHGSGSSGSGSSGSGSGSGRSGSSGGGGHGSDDG